MFDELVRRLRRRGDAHTAVSVNSGRQGRVSAVSSTRVDHEEAARQEGDVLPERHAMSVIDPARYSLPPLPIVEQPLDAPTDQAS